jgi:hypothetical protein
VAKGNSGSSSFLDEKRRCHSTRNTANKQSAAGY